MAITRIAGVLGVLLLAACASERASAARVRSGSPAWESQIADRPLQPVARSSEQEICSSVASRAVVTMVEVPLGVAIKLERRGGVTMHDLRDHASAIVDAVSPTSNVEWSERDTCRLREVAAQSDDARLEVDVTEVRIQLTTTDPDRVEPLRYAARRFVDAVQ